MKKAMLTAAFALCAELLFCSTAICRVTEDKVFVHKCLTDDGKSVTAGDGMASVALPDGRSIFLMGDSFVCKVKDGVMDEGGRHMYRNSMIVYDPQSGSSFCVKDGAGPGTSAAVPPGYDDESKWYWPGHGIAIGDTLYVFQYLMYQKSKGTWGFAYESTHLQAYKLPEIKLVQDRPIAHDPSADIHPHVFGVAAIADGDYIYIYAQTDVRNGFDPISEASVARCKAEEIWGGWEYWNGKGWSRKANDSVSMEGLSSVPVSAQFSVFKTGDKYVLLTEHKTLWVSEIYTFTSSTPQGPWENCKMIYSIPASDDKNLFYYNAMAHPQFMQDGNILVTYDVNTNDFWSIFKNAENYRPRAVWVPISEIINQQ